MKFAPTWGEDQRILESGVNIDYRIKSPKANRNSLCRSSAFVEVVGPANAPLQAANDVIQIS
jgi:hypothetical protein